MILKRIQVAAMITASTALFATVLAVFAGLKAGIVRLQHWRAILSYFAVSALYVLPPVIRNFGNWFTDTEFLNAAGFYGKLGIVTYIAWLTWFDLKHSCTSVPRRSEALFLGGVLTLSSAIGIAFTVHCKVECEKDTSKHGYTRCYNDMWTIGNTVWAVTLFVPLMIFSLFFARLRQSRAELKAFKGEKKEIGHPVPGPVQTSAHDCTGPLCPTQGLLAPTISTQRKVCGRSVLTLPPVCLRHLPAQPTPRPRASASSEMSS